MDLEASPTFKIKTPGDEKTVTLSLGAPTFLLGANGTGKSALVHDIVVQTAGLAVYIPGSRPNFFGSDALNMTPASREQMRTNLPSWDRQPTMRWNPIQGLERNEKAIHDIQAQELQFKVDAADKIAVEGSASIAIHLLQAGNSPFDRVNRLLASAALPIRVAMVKSELRVKRDDAIYSLARSSDGERSALILISVVISADMGTIFIIDEPELHLHRSIVVPLLTGLIQERPDCYFLISTHELELPASIESASSIAVRGCQWSGETVTSWDVDLLPPSSEIPEDLRVDILGSRRKILFVEGERDSLDRPMYALIFPEVSVRHKTGCKEVRQAVFGLSSTFPDHAIEPFGLVDNDQMSLTEIAELQANSVFALSVFTVESLYYSADVREALAARQAETFGQKAAELLNDAIVNAIDVLNKPETISHLAARICERTLRGQVLSAIPDRDTLVANNIPNISVTFPSPYPAELAKLKDLVAVSDLDAVIDRYPVRESGALQSIAKALRFSTRADYERAALARVASDAELTAKLRQKLEPLTKALSV